MAIEAGLGEDRWQDVCVRQNDWVCDFDGRRWNTADLPGQHYDQILAHFDQALQRLGLESAIGLKVLEIGAEVDYPFMQRFRDLGAECYAVNISFNYEEPDAFLEFPEKTLADMNDLPFRDGVFDLAILSATSHHSPDLARTFREVYRVLTPRGTVLLLSDPLSGWIKRLGKRGSHERHALIHENEYSIFR